MKSSTTQMKAIKGKKMASPDKPKEATFSAVDMTGLPMPRVVFEDNNRKRPVLACTTPAVPPPTIMPNPQCKMGLSICKNDVVSIVPARMEIGVAMVSSKLSIKGI